MMAAMSTPASDATVLVTGGTGLLGRVVVHRLRAAGCQVRVLTRNPSRATAVAGAELFPGDLRDPASLRRALSFAQVVVHCASDIQSAHDVDEEVADRLVHHVGAGPVGMAEDLGGPEVLPVRALASSWLSTTGRRRLLLPVPFPGALGRQFRAGANLCPGQASAGLTWQQYLDQAHLVQAAGR